MCFNYSNFIANDGDVNYCPISNILILTKVIEYVVSGQHPALD